MSTFRCPSRLANWFENKLFINYWKGNRSLTENSSCRVEQCGVVLPGLVTFLHGVWSRFMTEREWDGTHEVWLCNAPPGVTWPNLINAWLHCHTPHFDREICKTAVSRAWMYAEPKLWDARKACMLLSSFEAEYADWKRTVILHIVYQIPDDVR